MCPPRPHLHAEPFHKQRLILCHASGAAISLTSQHVSKMLLCRSRLLMSEEPLVQRWKTLEVGGFDLQGFNYAA